MSSPDMSAPARVFHLFPQLPPELREEVWRYCLPYRVFELDHPAHFNVFEYPPEDENAVPCMLGITTVMNGRPPLICRVCRESRAVASKAGDMVVELWRNRLTIAHWNSSTMVCDAWQDRTREAPHLNWWAAYKADFGSGGRPLHCLLWEAAQSCGIGSLTIEYLGESNHRPSPSPSPSSSPARGAAGSAWSGPGFGPPIRPQFDITQVRDLKCLRQLPTWLIVMRVIVVHSDLKHAAATGLFGLLGDAPVQVVDVSERSRTDALFDMAKACERETAVTISQDFHRESVDSMKQRLKEVIIKKFDSEELVSSLRPAIMFRPCTQNCNRRA